MASDLDDARASQLPPLVRGLLSTIAERHKDMTDLVSGLAAGGLDWRLDPEAASLAGLCLHILDVEEHLARLVAGQPHEWAGENGSRMGETASEEVLVAEIARVGDALRQAIENADPASLPAELVEDLDHCAMHYGQMQLTRHAWEAAHPEQPRSYKHWR